MSRLAWAGLAVLTLMALFAAQGGEYSTGDYFELKRRVVEESTAEVRLRRIVDSLSRYRKAIETDPKVQERVAREQWGMIRPGERVYKLVTPRDS